jgi:hypothetical protein
MEGVKLSRYQLLYIIQLFSSICRNNKRIYYQISIIYTNIVKTCLINTGNTTTDVKVYYFSIPFL